MAIPARGVLEIRSADAEHVIALYNPLVIGHFSRPPSEGELGILREMASNALAENVRGGMLFVVARRSAGGGIEPRVREFFEQMVRENSARFGASAAVVLMQGFAGSLMRSFITGLILLKAKRNQLQIFGAVDAAVRWLAPLHGLGADELLKAYEKAIAATTGSGG